MASQKQTSIHHQPGVEALASLVHLAAHPVGDLAHLSPVELHRLASQAGPTNSVKYSTLKIPT